MKQLILLSAFWLVLFMGYAQPNTWSAIDSLNGPGKSVTTSFVLNDNGFLVGGLLDQDFTRKMYSYNPIQNDWDDELSWGGETGSGQNRGSAVSFVVNNIAYVGLGEGSTANYYKDLWQYDPVAQTWTQLADFAGSARHGAVAFATSTHGYVGTGQSETGLTKDFYKYNPLTNTWEAINDFPGTARKYAVGFMMGDQGYLATGDDGTYRNDLWQYHPEFDLWVQKANMPTLGRSGAVGWGTFPTLYVATGEDANGTYQKDVWEYNFYGNTWFQRADFPGLPRKHATAFVINDVAYVGTGYNSDEAIYLDDFFKYERMLGMETITLAATALFPNPTSDEVHVTTDEAIMSLSAYNTKGEAFKLSIVSSNSFSLKDLPVGNYFLVGKTHSGKIIHAQIVKI
jgi:N-acetylneuraminic acid mutarotase